MKICEASMSLSDDECVRSCLDGHPGAFRPLVQRYQSPLLRYLGARLGNSEEAAEAAQESLVRAYFALGQLRKPGAFFPWLLGIADRVAKESQRAARRRRAADVAQIEPRPPAEAESGCRDVEVTEAVAGLPETYRQVIVLRYYEGQSCAQIGHALGIPLGTVTKRLSRAYGMLREHLRATNPGQENEALP